MRLPRGLRSLGACAALLSWLCVGCATPPRPDGPLLALGAGELGLLDDESSLAAVAEYRFRGFSCLRLVPTLGLTADVDGLLYGGVGLTRDFWLDEHWVAAPSFAAGLFRDSDKVRLGSELQFRSGFELGYRFDNDLRLAVGFFHLSNANIAARNPGTELLLFSLLVPLDE